MGTLLLLQILGEHPQSGDSFPPKMHCKCSSPDCQSLKFCFPSCLGFSSVLWETIIPVLPKRFSPSFSYEDILPLYRKLTAHFVQFTLQLLSFLFMHSGWHLDPYRSLCVMTLPSRWASWKPFLWSLSADLELHLELSPVNSFIVSPTASRSHFLLLILKHISTLGIFYLGNSDSSQIELDFTH